MGQVTPQSWLRLCLQYVHSHPSQRWILRCRPVRLPANRPCLCRTRKRVKTTARKLPFLKSGDLRQPLAPRTPPAPRGGAARACSTEVCSAQHYQSHTAPPPPAGFVFARRRGGNPPPSPSAQIRFRLSHADAGLETPVVARSKSSRIRHRQLFQCRCGYYRRLDQTFGHRQSRQRNGDARTP